MICPQCNQTPADKTLVYCPACHQQLIKEPHKPIARVLAVLGIVLLILINILFLYYLAMGAPKLF